MPPTVFLSHAGADAAMASTLAVSLAETGILVHLDREELALGDSFIAFMERSLTVADYCLLLWSRNAAAARWVAVEWEAALYRSIQEKRAFLIAARLEEHPLPTLLACRLRVDLFPEWQPGIGQLSDLWQADRATEARTNRPVANASVETAAADAVEVFVTSEVFGVTVPVHVSLEQPAGVLLHRLIEGFKLPKAFDHEGRVGVRFDYALAHETATLEATQPLGTQGVTKNGVLWIETTITPYASGTPMRGRLSGGTLRSVTSPLEADARAYLREEARRHGLA